MYDSLLIRSGGGIVKESDLIRTTGSPALIIGLGGLGADALRALKKKMNVRMVPEPHEDFSDAVALGGCEDSPSGSPASSSDSAGSSCGSVRLLAIDAAADWEGTPDFPPGIEYINIEKDGAVSSFSEGDARKKNRNTPFFDWLSFFLIDSSQTVFLRLKSILQKLSEKAASEACSEDSEEKGTSTLSVHIVSGIAGGMGGCLADLCYMVRYILEEIEPGFDRLYTYLLLPDLLTSDRDLANTYLVPKLERNSYAMLKEMDYLMSIRENREEFRQTYRFGEIRSRNTPADTCFLMQAPSAHGIKGRRSSRPRDAVIDLLSEFLFAWITEEDPAADPENRYTAQKASLEQTRPQTAGNRTARSAEPRFSPRLDPSTPMTAASSTSG